MLYILRQFFVMLKPSSDTCSSWSQLIGLLSSSSSSKQAFNCRITARQVSIFKPRIKLRSFFWSCCNLMHRFGFSKQYQQPSHCHHNQSNLYLIFSKNPRVLNQGWQKLLFPALCKQKKSLIWLILNYVTFTKTKKKNILRVGIPSFQQFQLQSVVQFFRFRSSRSQSKIY